VVGDKIVAVGLLTKRDVQLLGPTFERLWPLEEAPCFFELVRAIDEADQTNDPSETASAEVTVDHSAD